MADRRYIDGDGIEWASRYESSVYSELRRVLGSRVRKCGEGDAVSYSTPVKRGVCLECESGRVVQQRSYTPDIFVRAPSSDDPADGYFIESKGFWPAPKRNLLRSVVSSNPDLDLVLVFQRDLWVTKGKTKYSDYCERYLKGIPYLVWDVNSRIDLADLIWSVRNERKEV